MCPDVGERPAQRRPGRGTDPGDEAERTRTHDARVVLETRLVGTRALPARLAFAFLSGGRAFAVTVAALPLALLAASLWVSAAVADLLFGVPGLLLVAFWWSTDRYANSSASIDTGRGTLTLEHSRYPAWTRQSAIDLDDVAAVSVVTLGDAALCRFTYESRFRFSPPDFAVPAADLPTALDALRRSGALTGDPDRTHLSWRSPSPAFVRVLALPTVLLGVPVVAVWLFGAPVLVGSNAAVLAWVFGLWATQRHVTTALDLRPSGSLRAVLVDIVLTLGLILGALAVAAVVLW